jgi:hypothetical protein
MKSYERLQIFPLSSQLRNSEKYLRSGAKDHDSRSKTENNMGTECQKERRKGDEEILNDRIDTHLLRAALEVEPFESSNDICSAIALIDKSHTEAA